MSSVRFFFFQAEDGIRDLTVTGVQTCALPISCAGHAGRAHAPGQRIAADPPGGCRGHRHPARGLRPRSEERRVGKSVDLGGRRIIKKKKKIKGTTTYEQKKVSGDIAHVTAAYE